jgi:ABC-2 type transport system ATP-binding protein
MTAATPAGVTCRGLTKRYGGAGGIVALDGLEIDVPAGSIFGLLGPNGAGKTTTLRLITGLARPTSGSVAIDGALVADDAARNGEARRGIGVLDQDPRYYGWMCGRELVELAGRLEGLTPADARTRALETLRRVGLADASDRRIAGYSGGMRQRLGIAQALVADPRLLILDEPVSSLDPEGRRDLLALIVDLRASATVIFSTHVLADVERICDRVAILDHGRLVTEGPLDGLLERYAQPLYRIEPEPGQAAALEALTTTLRAIPWIDHLSADGSRLVVSVTDETAASAGLLPLVVDAGLRLAVFERVRPSLEDVFLRLVGRDPSDAAAA